MHLNQKGVAHWLLLIAGLGVIVYILLAGYAPFKDNLFSVLNRKQESQAATNTEIAVLTQQLVSQNDQIRKDAAKQSSLAGDMASTAFRRKQLLLELAKNNPQEFLKQATLVDKAKDFPPLVQKDLEKITFGEGNISRTHADSLQNHEIKDIYTLKLKSEPAKSYDLYFADNRVNLQSGSTVRVKAVALDNKMVVGSMQGAHEIAGTSLQLLASPDIKVSGTVKIAALLVNFDDDPNNQPFGKADILNTLINNQKSVKNFYSEASQTKISISADAYGWYSAPRYSDCTSLQALNDISNTVLNKAKQSGFNPDNYQYFSFIFPSTSACPGIGGFGELGGNKTWIFDPSVLIFSHEFGHNFGVHHANGLRCGNKAIDVYSSCTNWEYGDLTDIMGLTPHLFNGPHDLALGYLTADKVQTVSQNGVYQVGSLKLRSSLPNILKIEKKDTNEFYFLDYRQLFGQFDTEFTSGPMNVTDNIIQGVGIRIWDGLAGTQTKIIDANPLSGSNNPFDSLIDNAEFYDPFNGVRVKQISHNLQSATVEVTFSAPTVAKVTVSPDRVNSGDTVTVDISNVSNPTDTDWVGLYKLSEQDPKKWIDWIYIGSCNKSIGAAVQNKSCGFKIPAQGFDKDSQLPYEIYNFRLFRNNTYQLEATSNNLNVNITTTPPVTSPSPTPQPVTCATPIHAFSYNNQKSSYYYSLNEGFFPALKTAGWTDTGTPFYAYKTQISGTVPVYSFYYNSNRLSRYLTTNTGFFSALTSAGWTNEGVVFYAYPTAGTGRVPIYSYYYSNRLDRYLTPDPNYSSSQRSWTNEGIFFYAFKSQINPCTP